MKVFHKSLLALPLALTVSLAHSQPQTSKVCAGTTIPAGWAVVSTTTSNTECGNGGNSKPASNNMWVIENTVGQTSLAVCSGTPVPQGWVIVNTQTNATCRKQSFLPAETEYNNAWTITNTAGLSSLQICAHMSSLPAGWAISQFSSNSGICLPKSSTGIYNGVDSNVALITFHKN